MVFWLLAIAVTAVACAALYYASAGRAVNVAGSDAAGATTAHFRLQLKEIERDLATGRLAEPEAVAAKGELARELLRLEGEATATKPTGLAERRLLPVAILGVAVLAFGVYSLIGAPEVPSRPLASRTDLPTEEPNYAAIAGAVEQQLAITPDDLGTLQQATSVYLQLARYDDAVTVLRHMLELTPPSADLETNLALALMMQQGGDITGEPMALMQSAAARDPKHVPSRFYLAAEATRIGDNANAVAKWNELLALGKGDEPWVPMARNGLADAEAALKGDAPVQSDADQNAMIQGMVEGLSDRLAKSGGTLEEWTRLVQSRLVLGQTDLAQKAYDDARAAFPDASARGTLETLAKSGGLK
jgi:cytochrome c-type biogenesis protein CcmH